MSDLAERLRAQKPVEQIVTIGDDQFLVRGLRRVQKNELVNRCTAGAGKMNTARFEAEILAACVLDPQTGEQVLPNPDDWDIPADVAGPLVDACSVVCGFNKQERDAIKNSEPTEN